MVVLFQMLGAAFLFIQLLMALLWFVYYLRRNAGIVDIGWAAGFPIAAFAYFLLGSGSGVKSLLLFCMVAIWSWRLGSHLWRRYLTAPEDIRYAQIRTEWGERNSDFKFLMLFTFQGILVLILSLPMMIVGYAASATWSGFELLGIAIWVVGVTGEYFADEQLRSFKAKGKTDEVCVEGLWRYTRHPNYFFEWIVWIGYAFFAFPSSGGLLAFVSPALMYYILRYVSGVPMAEAHLLKVKGAAYQHYQENTSEFFPWFPKLF